MGSIIRPIAGEKIAIGTAYVGVIPDDDEIQLSDFVGAGITYTEIEGWLTKGAYGDSRQEVSEALINRQRLATTGGTTDGGNMQNVFLNIRDDAGQVACKAAVLTNNDYRVRVQSNDAPSARSSVVTMTIAGPGVVTWAAHGLEAGDQVKFTTTGALATGITAGTTYFVKEALTADTFTIAATAGGTAIRPHQPPARRRLRTFRPQRSTCATRGGSSSSRPNRVRTA